MTITLSNSNNGWPGSGGSFSKTSRPAAAITPDFNASAKSSSLMIPPLLVLMIKAVCFINASWSTAIILRVSEVSGTWRLITSEVRSNSSNPTSVTPNSFCSSSES